MKLSDHVIKSDDGPFKGFTALMVDLGVNEFKDLNIGRLHTKNRLQMLMLKKYIIWNMFVLLLNNYV